MRATWAGVAAEHEGELGGDDEAACGNLTDSGEQNVKVLILGDIAGRAGADGRKHSRRLGDRRDDQGASARSKERADVVRRVGIVAQIEVEQGDIGGTAGLDIGGDRGGGQHQIDVRDRAKPQS
ncbi:hypothetical protein GCM10009810_38710 [Nostocoides vanveenii]|uniref:Uncharacterized protein n=1 Tax=Nostocoides vanveenii TaxID=330835 RepID=A0ABP4XGX2_9MICO